MTYEPKTEHRFSFGLWTVGNPGSIRSVIAFGTCCRPSSSWNCSPRWAHGA